MSNIIRARRQIETVANELRTPEHKDLARRLDDALEMMYRRSPVRRMSVRSQPITPEIREEVLELARTTDMHSSEIAARLHINPGRVSEILQGDR